MTSKAFEKIQAGLIDAAVMEAERAFAERAALQAQRVQMAHLRVVASIILGAGGVVRVGRDHLADVTLYDLEAELEHATGTQVFRVTRRKPTTPQLREVPK